MKKKEEVVIKKPESYKTLLEHFKMSQESLKKSQEMTNLMLQNFNQEREDRKVRLAEIEEKKTRKIPSRATNHFAKGTIGSVQIN